jgi:SAM-dependent methyltransferase
MSEPISYSRLNSCRKAVRRRWRRVWDLPLVRRPRYVAQRTLADGMRVLDVGASDRRLAGRLRESFPALIYESMDVDRCQPHDYYSMDDVTGPYDAVILFEVLEHLPLVQGRDLLLTIHRILRPGGVLLVSTPNVFNPWRCLRTATHVVSFGYDELGGLLMMTGFRVRSLLRSHNDPVHRFVLRRYVFRWLFRILDMDFARSIVAVAERAEASAQCAMRSAE